MVVRYRSHPWFGRTFKVANAIQRGDECFLRVEYRVANRVRWIELPVWMFDTAECAAMILAETPVVHVKALMDLHGLLRHTRRADNDTRIKTKHSSSQRQGDAREPSEESISDDRTAPPVSTASIKTTVGDASRKCQEASNGTSGPADR